MAEWIKPEGRPEEIRRQQQQDKPARTIWRPLSIWLWGFLAVFFALAMTGKLLEALETGEERAARLAHLQEQDAKEKRAEISAEDKASVEANEARERERAEYAACLKSAVCLGKRQLSAAAPSCMAAIANLAKYDHKWGEGEPFTGWNWAKKKKKADPDAFKDDVVMTYYGSDIKFQNGFSAYQRHRYECDWSVKYGLVIEVRASPNN